MRCDPLVHKAARTVYPIRRMGAIFVHQCPDCLRAVGKPISPDDLGDVLPRDVPAAERVPRARGRTGLGGTGNSRRRDYERRIRAADWRRKRDACLQRANWECQAMASEDCAGIATQADHLSYRGLEDRDERPDELQAVCGPCNLELRSRRMMAEG